MFTGILQKKQNRLDLIKCLERTADKFGAAVHSKAKQNYRKIMLYFTLQNFIVICSKKIMKLKHLIWLIPLRF